VTELAPSPAAGSPPADRAPAIEPQHLLLVLPSTGEFDSRSYRIARELIGRGHRVTMLARWKAGLPDEEMHPAGYRIIRVHASAADGVPFKPLGRVIGEAARRVHRWRTGGRPETAGPAPGAVAEARPADRAHGPVEPNDDAPPRSRPGRRASWPRRAWASAVRRFAIPLTIGSHTRNARLLAPDADLYHGMAYMGIPIALDLGRRNHAPVIYDARDIYLEARNLAMSRGVTRWLAARAEQRWARRAIRVITVNDAYADVMAERLRVERPLVVMNCSYRTEPREPRERRFHAAFGLDPARKVVLYHGGLFPERGIEQLMDAIRDVPGATLVLMGYGVLEPELRSRALQPGLADRVRLMGAVDPADLLDWVACADVVAMPIQASTLNHRLTTPNKLFEAMAAGVPSVVSDLPGMATIVRETGCGTLVDPTDPAAIAAAVRDVIGLPDAEWQAWRRRCLAAAHETYSWEVQVARLLELYSSATGRRW
jgi:glycosyltransferase involved in cell wall biosynthesis